MSIVAMSILFMSIMEMYEYHVHECMSIMYEYHV